MARRARVPRGSAASRVFIALIAAVVVVGAGVAGLLLLETQRAERAEAETVTSALAESLASTPDVAAALAGDASAATSRLQPFAEQVMAGARVDFVTIMDAAGIRVTHRDPAEIGKAYLGTIPGEPQALTEEFTGTLGPSIRTIVPVERGGSVVGWVSVGVTVGSIASSLWIRLPAALAIALAIVAAGVVGALVARRATAAVTGDLPAGAVRDALSSYESLRTLGEALRAQTHEHGNRMHTAVALLELGRTPEAIEILTETSRQSQQLVDQVNARRGGDPTVGALLIGKASQAAERGIRWSAAIDPDAPHSVLTPVDQVALVGNLVDNALDAAAAGPEPRWVRVAMSRTEDADLTMTVSDSGEGVPAELRERIFERGFSTKPAGADGRGVGLALVRAVVTDAGGAVDFAFDAPTTVRVTLPGRREK